MAEQKHKEYDSNPFTLSFSALGRFFNSNASWAIVLIVLGVIGFLFQMVSNVAQVVENTSSGPSPATTSPTLNTDPAVIAAIIIFFTVLALVFIVVATTLKVFLQSMFSYVALKSEEEQSVTFKEAFDAVAKRFWRLFWADLLASLKILGWLFVFIIPGIIAGLRYSMLPYVIMAESEKEKGVKDSHDKTKALSKGRLVEVFGVTTVGAIIPIIGSLIDLSGKAALFNQFSYYNQKNLEKPKVHWLNYIGFILLALIMLLVAFVIVAAVLIAIANR